MNQRIQELMIEAFQSHYGDPVTPVSREKAVELVSGWGEKFAELIVRECMTIGFNTVYKVDDDSAAVAVYQNIKEHFGVAE
jgi:hypothetical protein